jgi:hypothetical protein
VNEIYTVIIDVAVSHEYEEEITDGEKVIRA